MQKLLEKNEIIKNKQEVRNKLTVEQIEKFYFNQNKIKTSKTGLEYERLSLDKETFCAAKYEKLEKIITHFISITGWKGIIDNSQNKTLLGAKSKNGSSISLEPGCQMELSLAPEENILDIDSKATKIIDLLDKIADLYDVVFVPYGINPYQIPDEITILDKERYKIMDEYLPYCKNAELCPKMMRKTAGIQINIDFENKKDAYLKLKFYNLIMPFVNGLFSNSPLENDSLGEFKSARSHVWLFTGQNRCNFFYKDIFSTRFGFKKYDNIFKDYINKVLDVPMVYIEREGKTIPLQGRITFRQFMKHGYKGYRAAFEDYILHQSLCFPDVRLKSYIEIRNHDSSNFKMALALCAFYKGLNTQNADFLLKKFNYLKIKDIEQYNKLSSEKGLDFDINMKIKKDGWDVITELFNISKNSLNSTERSYLKPVLEMIKERKTQSDLIIDYNVKNTSELIDYLYS